jgi:hypothetical protein
MCCSSITSRLDKKCLPHWNIRLFRSIRCFKYVPPGLESQLCSTSSKQLFSRSWKKKHPDSTKVKIAFGLSYAIHAERMIQSGSLKVGGYICSDPANLVMYMVGVRVITAIWLGIFFLLRKNEFLPHKEITNSMQEPCRRNNLRFFSKHMLEITYSQIGIQIAASVTLRQIRQDTDVSFNMSRQMIRTLAWYTVWRSIFGYLVITFMLPRILYCFQFRDCLETCRPWY